MVRPPQKKDPQPRAGAAAEPVVRASGDLAVHPLAQVLLDAMEQRYMGVIDLRRQKIHKRVYVMMGFPVFVESALRSETLGQLLVSSGRLRPEEHRQALRLMTDEQVLYGEALIRLGLMEEEEVHQTLEFQVRRKLEPCLSWREGAWQYVEDPSVVVHVQRHTVDPVELVFGSLPRYVNMEQELDALGREADAHRLELSPRGQQLAHRFTACFGDGLLADLERGRTLAQLLEGDGLHETVEQIHVLLQCGMASRVRAARPSGDAQPVRGEDALDLDRLALRATTTRVAPVEAVEAEPEPEADALAARQLIEATYLGLFSATYYELLELTPGCNHADVEAAFEARRRLFSDERLARLDLGDEGTYLDEVRRHLDEAHAVLADTGRRAAYDAELAAMEQSHTRLCAPDEEEPQEAGDGARAEQVFDEGVELSGSGDHDKAAEAFADAHQQDEQAEYRTMEAWSLFRAEGGGGQAAAAVLPMVLDELERTPGQYMIHLVAARLYRAAEQHDPAVEQFQAALQLNPCMRVVIDELADYLEQSGQAHRLEEEYRRVLLHLADRDHELAADLWKRLTVLYHQHLDDDHKARKALEVARYMEPEDPQVQELEMELELFPDDD